MKRAYLLITLAVLFSSYAGIGFGAIVEEGTTQGGGSSTTAGQTQGGSNGSDENNGTNAAGQACDPKKDIMLNMNIPFVGRCIKKDPTPNPTSDSPDNSTIGNVFPKLMGGLIRLTMTLIYIIGFLGILIGGFMIAGQGTLGTKEQGKKLIISVIIGLILLGASGMILNLINPNFFGVNS